MQEFIASGTSCFDIEIIKNSLALELQNEAKRAFVKANKLLTATSEPEKRHLEIALSLNMPYQTGDYLAILPTNPHRFVRRIMSHFDLELDSKILVKGGSSNSLPSDLTVYNMLSSHVELNQPAT